MIETINKNYSWPPNREGGRNKGSQRNTLITIVSFLFFRECGMVSGRCNRPRYEIWSPETPHKEIIREKQNKVRTTKKTEKGTPGYPWGYPGVSLGVCPGGYPDNPGGTPRGYPWENPGGYPRGSPGDPPGVTRRCFPFQTRQCYQDRAGSVASASAQNKRISPSPTLVSTSYPPISPDG